MVEDYYQILDIIGCGGFASCYLARCREDDHFVAIKTMPIKHEQTFYDEVKAMNEVFGLKHAVQIEGQFSSPSKLSIVMEYCPGGNLRNFIIERAEKSEYFLEEDIAHIMRDIMTGLAEIHARGLVHRDIKCGNILQKNGVYKIADFGLAVKLNYGEKLHQFCGTKTYICPEMMHARGTPIYDAKCDIWSAGAICCDLTDILPPNCNASRKVIDFIGCCMNKNSTKRLSATEALQHPFLADSK